MTKYLFLLGFFLCSISFLSTPVMAGKVYKGIVYGNSDEMAVSCSWVGMTELKQTGSMGGCEKGAFRNFIFFSEEEGYSNDKFKFIHSFVSSDNGDNWEEVWIRVRAEVVLEDCRVASVHEKWKKSCGNNFVTYENYINNMERHNVPGMFGTEALNNRAPDSIK